MATWVVIGVEDQPPLTCTGKTSETGPLAADTATGANGLILIPALLASLKLEIAKLRSSATPIPQHRLAMVKLAKLGMLPTHKRQIL